MVLRTNTVTKISATWRRQAPKPLTLTLSSLFNDPDALDNDHDDNNDNDHDDSNEDEDKYLWIILKFCSCRLTLGLKAETIFQGCAQDSFLVWTQSLATALSDNKTIFPFKLWPNIYFIWLDIYYLILLDQIMFLQWYKINIIHENK